MRPLAPSLGTEWRFWEGKGHRLSVSASLSQSYRIPNLNAMYWQPGGNPDIRSERALNYETGLQYKLSKARFSLESSLSAYQMQVSDWILWLERERFFLPEGTSFQALYDQRNAANIGELINMALEKIEETGRRHRVLYSSWNAGAVAAAVLAGLAISVLPESGMRPGMRILGHADGFPTLPTVDIGLARSPHERSALAEALAEHIISSLDNMSDAAAAAE
ncbi:MAG: TonB-dependent receptor [Bacteroidales bacterium]|nr:TonB-dependent receptor [Bacteroidales bacterium]